jgi:hypothetical protein
MHLHGLLLRGKGTTFIIAAIEPVARGREPGSPADDLLYLLYRSGEAPVLNATVHQWHDLAVMIAQGFGTVGDAGCGGVGYFLDSLKRHQPPVHMVARLRIGGQDRYRVDYQARTDRGGPTTIACDGEHRWHVYQDQIMVGPAAPLPRRDLTVGAYWLLTCRLGGGPEITYHGRRAFQLRVTSGDDFPLAGPLLSFPADAIVDAETGCLLRLISYAGDRPASWWELRDISMEPGDPGEFRVPVPPGVRIVEETGNPFTDAAAVMPGVTGSAVRAAAEVVRRTAGAVSATRSFLDDLRGRTQPPAAG